MPTTVFTIANQKGGVGKTTTAVNLAAGLALKKVHTLLIDLDPQANATSSLGIEKQEGRSLYSALRGADYIVVGRPIRQAADPRAKAEEMQAKIAGLFRP